MWTLEELLVLWNDEASRAEMTPEQLGRLEELLVEQAEEVAAGDEAGTQAALDELAEIDATLNGAEDDENDGGVRGALAAAESAAEEAATQVTSLLDRIRASDAGDGDDGEGGDAGDAGDGDARDGDAGDAGTGDGGDAGDGDAGDGDAGTGDAGDGDAGEGDGAQAVAAGANGAARRSTTRVSRVAARRPSSAAPRARSSHSGLSLVASANIESQGIRAGQPLEDADLSAAFLSAWEQSDGYSGPRRKIPVAFSGARRAEDIYPADRCLGRDPALNEERINRVTSGPAIVAAGGRCVPSEIRYDLPVLMGTEARPFRDEALVRFGANRGGVVTLQPPVLSDVDDAIGFWTEANDQNPTNPTVKPCLTVDCPDDSEDVVEAITKCLRFGNFRSKFFGEQIRAILDLAAVNHARQSETRWITKVGANSTDITAGEVLGTTRAVLAALARRSTAIRSLHRLDDAFPLRWSAPFWLRDNMQVDLIRQMPVGSLDETLAVADAQIDRWISQFGINVTWLLDGEPGQVFGKQNDGGLLPWPDVAVTYLYPEGTWLFLDGGSIDLGIMRDTVTTSTNDFQVFAETFEEVHFHGVESDRLEIDICPDGSAAALVDLDICGPGPLDGIGS